MEIRGEKNNNVKVNIKSIEYKIIVDTVKVSKRLKKKRVILEIYKKIKYITVLQSMDSMEQAE